MATTSNVGPGLVKQLVGKCPVIQVTMGGVPVPCLVDTGSMVTTITVSFFDQHFKSWGEHRLRGFGWLTLMAANGLAILYIRYLELDLQVLGKTIPQCGVLVIRDPLCPRTQQCPDDTPGLLGMNAIHECYQELYG